MAYAIEVNEMTKTLGTFTLGPISLTLPEGCVLGLIGENGAGKSTLISLLLGLKRPDGGSYTLLGENTPDDTACALLRQKIGVVPAIVVSTLLLISLALPLSFKYGIEKARILSYLMIGLLCGSAGLLTVFTREQVFSLDMILVNTFLPMLGAAAFILSAFLSVHIYSRKAL